MIGEQYSETKESWGNMNRQGKVIELKKDRAIVQLIRHSACGDCGACQMGHENMQMKVEASNDVGANIGDLVEIDLETNNVLRAAFFVYVIPLIALVIGIVGGKYLFSGLDGNIEAYSAILGVVLMAICFIAIKYNERKFQSSKKYLSQIVKVIGDNE